MPFKRESFVPLLLSFVPRRVRRYSDFKISKMRQERKLVIFKDIEMGPTTFERELFVSVCTFRLYFKGFGDTMISKFHKCVKRGSRSFLKISKWNQRRKVRYKQIQTILFRMLLVPFRYL